MIFSGSITLPTDLDMARPSPSSVQPFVAVSRYGACPLSPTPTNSELWNQPRYWSPPSRYRFAGQGNSSLCPSTQRWLDPESNHTSRMSFSFVKLDPPHLPHFASCGSRSAAE